MIQHSTGGEGLAFAGWELPDTPALHKAAAELTAAGHGVEESTEPQRAARQVRGLVHTTDPGGLSVELFCGAVDDHELFVSPAGVSGFVTGDMGLGHIVLGTTNCRDAVDFYTGVLGFRVSDYMRGGATDFMLEVRTLDDVGYTLDRHHTNGVPISAGLGKHTNDHMVSFYSWSPSGFGNSTGVVTRAEHETTA